MLSWNHKGKFRGEWSISSGGTCARDDKHGYTLPSDIGTYRISPVSSPHNVNRHRGYTVYFANELGRVNQSGLWRNLAGEGRVVNLRVAKALCRAHFVATVYNVFLEVRN